MSVVPPPASSTPTPIGRDERVFTWITLSFAACIVTLGLWFQNRPKNSPQLAVPNSHNPLPSLSQVDLVGLTNLDGRRVESHHLDAPFLALNFIFTSCSLQCLAVNHRMADLQNRTQSSLPLKFASITIDPRTDSPQALSAFAAKFSADTNRWLFLTGDPSQLEAIRKSFFPDAPAQPSVLGNSAAFGATERILLFDHSGACLGVFNGLHPDCVPALESALRKSSAAPRP